jgi:hypothetical protein
MTFDKNIATETGITKTGKGSLLVASRAGTKILVISGTAPIAPQAINTQMVENVVEKHQNDNREHLSHILARYTLKKAADRFLLIHKMI